MIKAWFTRKNRTLIAFLCIACCSTLLQGCAASYTATVRHYREASVCCLSLKELPTTALRVGDRLDFELDANSLLYDFDSGKSYFRAFSLPDGPYPYKVTVSSYLVGDYLRSAYIFSPHIVTLDEQRRVVRSTGQGSFGIVPTGFFETVHSAGNFRHKLEGSLVFTGADRDERYLLVATADELLKRKTAFPLEEVPMLILGSGRGLSGKPGEVLVPNAPGGILEIAVSPLESARAVTPQLLFVGEKGTSPAGSVANPVAPESGAGGEKKRGEAGPDQVTVTLATGKKIGRLQVGKSRIDEARGLYEAAGSGFGPEHESVATFSIGTATLAPRRLYTPPGTFDQLYFDAAGTLVLFIDKPSPDIGPTVREFRHRFPGARQTGRLVGAYELQVDLAPCISLIAVFRAVDDSVDSTGLAYTCGSK